MPPRPALASRSRSRPLSAIYIGSGSTPISSPPTIPDLPEPPSPSTSHGSGLPSPPATNSTGSGSVGDNNSNGAGSVRQRLGASRSNSSSEMAHGYDKPRNVKRNSQVFTDEEEDEGVDTEEDNTARLSGRRRQSKTAHEDGTSALDRVRSLTQRNRMVLDKLSSISRLNSPAPTNSPAPSHPRSPVSPPTASGSTSRTSVRPQSTSNPLPTPARRIEPSHSGSETERESQHTPSHSYSSDDLAATPPSRPEIRAPFPIRERRISAPASPAKGRPQRDRDRGPSPGPYRAPRKRMSMALSVDDSYRQAEGAEDRDILSSALAAVASSRRSPGSGKKTRQPLPREFRDRRSPEPKPQGEPSTPHRIRNGYGRSSPSSPRPSRTSFPTETQVSPRRQGQSRYSTVRELTRKHQTRWLSEDLSASAEADEESHHANGSAENVGRRQGHRGGSSETVLASNGGRSLIGEGLRAAGLTKRRDLGDDLFGGELTTPGSPRRTKSTGNSSVIQGELPLPAPRFDPHTPVNNWLRRDERMTRSGGTIARPGTSMAALHHDTPDILPPRTAPPGLRAYKSTYALTNREPILSPQVEQEFPDRAYSSPFVSVRAASVAAAPLASPAASKDMNAEHRRLMTEALTMFESQLSRLPPMGQTTTNTIPELFQNAQHLVHSLDKLNGMLKSGTNRALEAQIDAEVADVSTGIDLVELWRDVGAEHRESLRMSDEVVRNMTGFLLGVGKVLREATAGKDPQQHLRAASLDESATARLAPEAGVTHSGGRSSDGRKSRETRRSWDPRDMRESSLARLSSMERSHVRPASVLLRGSATSSSEGRSVADAVDGTPQTIKVSTMGPSSSMRRLFVSRDQRATPEIAPIQTSLNFARQDSPDKYEPSPTPTSRTSQSALSERHRSFQPASIPPSLSTLPSESLITRTVSASSSENSASRRKVSSNSTLTVRAEPSASSAFNSILKPSGATTSLTTATVSAEKSPGEPPVTAYYRPNIDRSESSGSSRAGPNGNVATFSRASLASVRLRSASNASSTMDEPSVRLEAAPVLSPMSGSETERPESWRRTIAARPRASLESAWEREREERNANRTATVAARKERRRTITEIFQR